MPILPLPSGLPDVLPPFAAQEFRVIYHMLKSFTSFGYQPVIPPLMEFEQSLLADQGAATARQVFRLMDPLSREMLALRADITTQITRIAENSLRDVARPLRLSYAGYTLRAVPEALRTRRQHTQIGIELFGATSTAYDAEVITVPIEALRTLSLTDLSLDISVPPLLDTLLQEHAASKQAIREAVARKDTSALRSMKADLIADIVDASGPLDTALASLSIIASHSGALADALKTVNNILNSLKLRGLNIPITLDMLEMRGFGYYSGAAFSLFLRNPAIEIGRGGHYHCNNGEEAVGFTCYIDDILAAIGDPEQRDQLGIEGHTPVTELREWHTKGYETVLLYSTNAEEEARRLGCTHVLSGGTVTALTSK